MHASGARGAVCHAKKGAAAGRRQLEPGALPARAPIPPPSVQRETESPRQTPLRRSRRVQSAAVAGVRGGRAGDARGLGSAGAPTRPQAAGVPPAPAVRTVLQPHQVQGVRWMLAREGVPLPPPGPPPPANVPTAVSAALAHHAGARARAGAVGGVLADDMGMGKTLTALYAVLAARRARGEGAPTLIVTPKSLLHQWAEQVATHTALPGGATLLYDGRALRAPLALTPDTVLVLTTYDTLKSAWLAGGGGDSGAGGVGGAGGAPTPPSAAPRASLLAPRYARVVLDEADVVRNATTQMARAAHAVRARARWCLTGTPLNNSIDDVAALARFIGVAPFAREAYWRRAAGTSRDAHVRVMQAWGAAFMLRRGHECLTLPPCTTAHVATPLGAAERAYYEAIAAGAMADYAATGDGGIVLSGIMRLRQVCVHPQLAVGGAGPPPEGAASRARSRAYMARADAPVGSTRGRRKGTPGKALACRVPPPPALPGAQSSRLRALLGYLGRAAEADPDARCIVFSQWTSALALVSAALTRARIEHVQVDGSIASAGERAARVAAFTAPPGHGVPVLLLALHAGCKGLDLSAATHVCMLDGWYNPAVTAQAVKRAHRLGQTRPVSVVHFYAPGTVETCVTDIRANKAVLCRALMASVAARAGAGAAAAAVAAASAAPPPSLYASVRGAAAGKAAQGACARGTKRARPLLPATAGATGTATAPLGVAQDAALDARKRARGAPSWSEAPREVLSAV